MTIIIHHSKCNFRYLVIMDELCNRLQPNQNDQPLSHVVARSYPSVWKLPRAIYEPTMVKLRLFIMANQPGSD